MKWCVIVPTIREDCFLDFLSSWRNLFKYHNVDLKIMEDNPQKSFQIPENNLNIEHYSWENIEKDLKDKEWIISRRTDCVRSYALIKTYQNKSYDFILSLDDDVRPHRKYNGHIDIIKEYEKVFNYKYNFSPYYNVASNLNSKMIDDKIYMRGYPFKYRKKSKVVLQYGVWQKTPDLDAITQLQYPIDDADFTNNNIVPIPKYSATTCCAMNFAIRREYIPIMYQLLMGKNKKEESFGFDRWGDIWSGLLAKRILDEIDGGMVINNAAKIDHIRASNVATNLKKESSGYILNESLWEKLIHAKIEGSNVLDLYMDLAYNIKNHKIFGDFSDKLSLGMIEWINILKQD